MELTADELTEARTVIARALDEDLRYGPDVTTLATVPADATTTASMVTREPGVIAGVGDRAAGARRGARRRRVPVEHRVEDGARLDAGGVALVIEAPTRGLLTAERTMLNLVCHLSGIATTTAAWVDAVEGTKAKIRDTRKTLPGLRALQKYAVRVGGGVNHRMGLGDAALIKDNHVAAAGSVVAALRAVRDAAPDLPCEVEVDSLEQLDDVLAEDVELVLLDNFPVWQTQIAVQRRDARVPGHQARVVGRSVARHRRGIRGYRRRLPGGRRAHPLGAGPRYRVGSVGVNQPSPRRGLLYTALAVAVLSLGVAVFALLRPTGDPEYTDAQRSDAKAATCAAFDTVRTGVATNTNVTAPGGPDDIAGALAVAAQRTSGAV